MIINLTKKKVLSSQTVHAVSFRTRARGMIGRRFENFDAMVFPRCNAVHTFFMSQPIDILVADKENKVLKTVSSVPPWKCCIRCPGAVQTVEFPAGSLEAAGTEQGDLLDLNGELDAETKQEIKQIISKDRKLGCCPVSCTGEQ